MLDFRGHSGARHPVSRVVAAASQSFLIVLMSGVTVTLAHCSRLQANCSETAIVTGVCFARLAIGLLSLLDIAVLPRADRTACYRKNGCCRVTFSPEFHGVVAPRVGHGKVRCGWVVGGPDAPSRSLNSGRHFRGCDNLSP